MAHEINLVPDIKDEMIRTLKLRNFIFFLCIVVASVSIGVTLIFGGIVGGQQIALNNKTTALGQLSTKLNSYSDLADFLTIKDQVGNIASITDNKKVLSRTFNILSALIPDGPDSIIVSELNVDLSGDEPTFYLEAQANAGAAPFIDYKVLDSFKKSMKYMRYDYGSYVDKDGNTIPAYCMIEKDLNGAYFTDSTKGMYAYWTIAADGCNPADEDNDELSSTGSESNSSQLITSESYQGYSIETYDNTPVVRVWRTPQFDEWYKDSFMGLDGTISGIPHFESSCITYSGEATSDETKANWSEANDTCLLVPDGDDGIATPESSNGRGAADELVLRFSANITLSPEVFNFNNTHMIALAPSGRRNVTDSYLQIQAMFGERARDCAEGDTACKTNGENQ